MRLKRILLLPDCHRPFHDQRAWDLVIKVGRWLKPDHTIVLGDFIDCYSVSSFDKDPNRSALLETELASANDGLDELDELTGKKHFIEGNHCARVEKYLKSKAAAVYNLVKIEELLKLGERGWSHTKYRDYLKLGKLYATHDVSNTGQLAHLKAQAAFEGNVVIGHTHRLAIGYVGNARNKPHFGAMLGWLGDVSKVDYTHKIQAQQNWALGFGIAFMEPDGNVHLRPIPIVEYKCCIDGKLFKV